MKNLIPKQPPYTWANVPLVIDGDDIDANNTNAAPTALAERSEYLKALINHVCAAQGMSLSDTASTQLLDVLDARYFKNSQIGSQATDEELSAAILAHLQATDPHPQYLTESEARGICQASDATLTALSGLTTAADTLPYATGVDKFSTTPLTAFARTLLDDANAATALATLGAVSRAELQNQSYISATTSGTAPTYVASLSLAPTLATGLRARIKFHAATSVASTLNINATGAKSLKQYDITGAKVNAVITTGLLTDVEYDGVDWIVLHPVYSSDFIRKYPSGTTVPTVYAGYVIYIGTDKYEWIGGVYVAIKPLSARASIYATNNTSQLTVTIVAQKAGVIAMAGSKNVSSYAGTTGYSLNMYLDGSVVSSDNCTNSISNSVTLPVAAGTHTVLLEGGHVSSYSLWLSTMFVPN